MNTTTTGSIASIIEKRRPLSEKIAGVEADLKSLESALQHLEEHRSQLLAQVDDPNVAKLLQDINLAKLQQSINTEQKTLLKLKERFCSKTVKIGVVGRARQGKSRLIQSLTGLSGREIPDGERQYCTGVPCTIYHNSSEESYADVWFYSEESFLAEVIGSYYEKLRLSSKPRTIDEFAAKPLPPLPSYPSPNAEIEALYLRLTQYHIHLKQYRHLLQQPSPRRISKDEIREYVVQETGFQPKVLFNYLAVKKVKIVCKFPYTDVGQIAFIDMPGLGDTGIIDEQNLIKSLGQDVDVILFVRMPKSDGDRWDDVDVRLYDKLRTTLIDLPINLWSFMILNRTEADSCFRDNSKICQDLVQNIANKNIDVVDCIVANCANTQEANKVLQQVLDYLKAKITNLDYKYALLSQQRFTLLQSRVHVELEKVSKALDLATHDTHGFALFEIKFQEFWRELTNRLEKLLKDLRKKRETVDLEFKKSLEIALQACRSDTGIPSIQEIEQRNLVEKNYHIIYEKYLNEIRARLLQHLLSLNSGLKSSLDKVKSLVAEVFIAGRLGTLTEARGAEFINSIAVKIPEELIPGIPGKLKYGFKTLAEFELLYQGFAQHRIRKYLDGLTPGEPVTQKLSPSPTAEQVHLNLKIAHAETLTKCENALKQLLSEPNQAAYAIVEDFVDTILRAPEVESEWRIFLQDVRGEIWQEFQELGERVQLRRDVLNSVEQATTANQSNLMRFLN